MPLKKKIIRNNSKRRQYVENFYYKRILGISEGSQKILVVTNYFNPRCVEFNRHFCSNLGGSSFYLHVVLMRMSFPAKRLGHMKGSNHTLQLRKMRLMNDV